MAKKPALPKPDGPTFQDKVKECLETIMGRLGTKTTKIAGLESTEVSAGPSASEYNALRNDVDLLRVRLNKLIGQIGDD